GPSDPADELAARGLRVEDLPRGEGGYDARHANDTQVLVHLHFDEVGAEGMGGELLAIALLLGVHLGGDLREAAAQQDRRVPILLARVGLRSNGAVGEVDVIDWHAV